MSTDAINIVCGQIDKHKSNVAKIKAAFKEGNGTSQMLEEISMEHYAITSLNEVLVQIGFQELVSGE